MIARTILRILTEAYSDEYLSKVPDIKKKEAELLIRRAKGIFRNPNQLNWFLRLTPPEDFIGAIEIRLNRLEHFFSLPIEAIHNFSFGSLSYFEAKEKLEGLEAKWQERQSRLIPIEKAYAEDSYVVDDSDDDSDDDDDDGYESEYKDSRMVEGVPEDIVVFPDGFRWVNLNIPYSGIEAKAMGHCGNEPRKKADDILLSLRQLVVQDGAEYLMPHATFVLMSNGYLRELKGFQNHKLAPKYMPYVVELFKQFHWINGIDNEDSYRPESDVTWDDFTREQLKDILRSNPYIKDEWVRYLSTGEDGTYDTGYGKMIVSDGGETVRKEYSGGVVEYYNRGGQLHREDGPAVESGDGEKEWRRNGKLHRDDGPAVERADGTKEWYRNGRKHRDDGPAVERSGGTKIWYRNGIPHRDDGPAVELPNGIKEWWRNGERHRDDGPAVMWVNPEFNQWYRNNSMFDPTDEEVARYEERIRRGEIAE